LALTLKFTHLLDYIRELVERSGPVLFLAPIALLLLFLSS
jgi:hypothetical protein